MHFELLRYNNEHNCLLQSKILNNKKSVFVDELSSPGNDVKDRIDFKLLVLTNCFKCKQEEEVLKCRLHKL